MTGNMKKINIFILSLVLLLSGIDLKSSNYIVEGEIETVRKDNYVTIRFHAKPQLQSYKVFAFNSIIGDVFIVKEIESSEMGNVFLAEFKPEKKESPEVIRAGMSVISMREDKSIDSRYNKKPYIERIEYKKGIISSIDKRDMVLISSGKFLMGSDKGDRDELPERVEELADYYIDKYEVSNQDFKIFIDDIAGSYPPYWKEHIDESGNFVTEYFKDLPAIVTYIEATEYAAWCGKRLPSEKEWEKAARFPLSIDKKNKNNTYTFGYDYREGISNTAELWADENTGKNLKETIKKEYKLEKLNKGYIPVKIYEPASASYYGVVHMDGNALEWTESWYSAYNNNYDKDKKYGTQYKVVRGGSYFLPVKSSRVTNRNIGGIPSLDKDRMAGFRCVKDVSILDRIN